MLARIISSGAPKLHPDYGRSTRSSFAQLRFPSIQKPIVVRVVKQREEKVKLKASAKANAEAVRADVEAMIVGKKAV